jgi:hypothetical protein
MSWSGVFDMGGRRVTFRRYSLATLSRAPKFHFESLSKEALERELAALSGLHHCEKNGSITWNCSSVYRSIPGAEVDRN